MTLDVEGRHICFRGTSFDTIPLLAILLCSADRFSPTDTRQHHRKQEFTSSKFIPSNRTGFQTTADVCKSLSEINRTCVWCLRSRGLMGCCGNTLWGTINIRTRTADGSFALTYAWPASNVVHVAPFCAWWIKTEGFYVIGDIFTA